MRFSHLVLASALIFGLPAVSAGPSPSPSAGKRTQDRDLAAVMKVVKRPAQAAQTSTSRRQSSSSRSSKTRSRYLKMEFGGSYGEELTVSIPFSLVELLASFDEERTLKDLGADSDHELEDIKLKDVIEALRDLGPGELLEVRDDDGWFRLWLE